MTLDVFKTAQTTPSALAGGVFGVPENSAPAIEVLGLTHDFGPTRVLDSISFAVPRGTIAGIVGENGAGKSTLFNILSGLLQPARGSLRLREKDYAPRSYRHALEQGVSRVFQEQALIPALPVYENLLLGHERAFERGGFRRHGAMIATARRIVDAAELDVDVTGETGSYDFSVRQSLEIARACLFPSLVLGISDPVVLLDEPTAALAREEEAAFFRLVRRLRHHATILFVSHRLTEVLAISDSIHVLKDGRLVASRLPAEVDEDQLHRLMVGRARGVDYYSQQQGPIPVDASGVSSRPVLAAEGLSLAGAFEDISFSVQPGEIVGIGGLLNSGKTRLGRAVAGLVTPASGTIRIDGDPVASIRPESMVALGVGYVPAERLTEGVIPALSIAWNVGLASGDRLTTRAGFWRKQAESSLATRAIQDLRIRADGPARAVETLSGGNQQKVVIARWAARQPKLLVLDNPTRGVDAGAREEIYAILRRLAAAGVAILVITDDLAELIGLSDRIFILRDRRQVAALDAAAETKPTEEALVALMLGSQASSLSASQRVS
ncbi:sugar ABC transporter ATP-binding protein [Kaistia terrae]|uniref:Sugar ABC transporter ATP-binding protein n=1 Tax=Kaistia terrae TaxID=537017 RepID=A0ABW0Q501_9HYPH|nr:sugar ABC transporter ATP-binding protein [Kaistia terrae]MCX5579709.1 sugar ABC transporter ATP-binding protein [Kaistia terrae]